MKAPKRGEGSFDFVVEFGSDPEFLAARRTRRSRRCGRAASRPPRNRVFSRKAKILAIGVEVRLAVARAQRMAVQDHDARPRRRARRFSRAR